MTDGNNQDNEFATQDFRGIGENGTANLGNAGTVSGSENSGRAVSGSTAGITGGAEQAQPGYGSTGQTGYGDDSGGMGGTTGGEDPDGVIDDQVPGEEEDDLVDGNATSSVPGSAI